MGQSVPEYWRKVKLGDCLVVLTDYHANGSYERLKANVELLDTLDYAVMIRTKNFEQNNFQGDLKYVTKAAYDFLSKSKVYPGDILMNKIANAGSVYYMPDLRRPVSLAMNLFLLRTDENKVFQRYIYYYLKANESYVKQFAIGTAATTITKNAVRTLDVLLPPLNEQKAIAHILGTLDDKIELNQQMNHTLEAIAHTLFNPGLSTSIPSAPKWMDDNPQAWMQKPPLCFLLSLRIGRSAKSRRVGKSLKFRILHLVLQWGHLAQESQVTILFLQEFQ